MKQKLSKKFKENDKLKIEIALIMVIISIIIGFSVCKDYSVLDMYLFDGYITETEEGIYSIQRSLESESIPIQLFDSNDFSEFYVQELGCYRIQSNSKQIITKQTDRTYNDILGKTTSDALIYILQKDGTYANTSDGTKLVINSGKALTFDMVNSKKYYYDSGNPYYPGYDSCLRYRFSFGDKLFHTFRMPLFWLAMLYLISCILFNMKKRLYSRYMTVIGSNKEISVDVLMQNFNKGYEKILKDLSMLKRKKFISDYTVDFDRRIVYFNQKEVSQDSSFNEVSSKICPSCGATTKVSSIGENKCEYCGTILK